VNFGQSWRIRQDWQSIPQKIFPFSQTFFRDSSNPVANCGQHRLFFRTTKKIVDKCQDKSSGKISQSPDVPYGAEKFCGLPHSSISDDKFFLFRPLQAATVFLVASLRHS
jgi:hypothetical protein